MASSSSDDGDDWSESWGGVEAQWYGSVLPRVRPFLPAGTVLESFSGGEAELGAAVELGGGKAESSVSEPRLDWAGRLGKTRES